MGRISSVAGGNFWTKRNKTNPQCFGTQKQINFNQKIGRIACRLELADLGLYFNLVKSILSPAWTRKFGTCLKSIEEWQVNSNWSGAWRRRVRGDGGPGSAVEICMQRAEVALQYAGRSEVIQDREGEGCRQLGLTLRVGTTAGFPLL